MRTTLRLATLATLLLGTSAAMAIPFTHSTDPGDNYTTSGVASFTTGGDDMDGMEVTVTFEDGSSETAIWATTGVDQGAASGSFWSLSMDGNTSFTDPFSFVYFADGQGMDITSILIDGAPGDTLFDYLCCSDVTPGSANGGPGDPSGPTDVLGSDLGVVNFLYFNQVALNGTFYGDLFTSLLITFANDLADGQYFSFISDTDTVEVEGDITPIPLPAVAWLMVPAVFWLRRKS